MPLNKNDEFTQASSFKICSPMHGPAKVLMMSVVILRKFICNGISCSHPEVAVKVKKQSFLASFGF